GLGFLQARHGESVRIGQGLGRQRQAMAVGVGLDHRHDAGIGSEFPDAPEVVAQRAEIDERAGGAAHAKPPSSRVWFSKRVKRPRKVVRTVPVGPLRCLPMMISAVPLSGLSLLKTS